VVIGAFGAHGLKSHLDSNFMRAYETGVQYHFYHTLSLLFVAIRMRQNIHSTYLKLSGMLFCLGVIVFSGSLYLLALSGVRAFGMITPIGGIAFIVAWGLLLVAALRDAQ